MPQDRKFSGEPYRGIPRNRPLLPEAFHLRIEPQVFNKPLDHHNLVARWDMACSARLVRLVLLASSLVLLAGCVSIVFLPTPVS